MKRMLGRFVAWCAVPVLAFLVAALGIEFAKALGPGLAVGGAPLLPAGAAFAAGIGFRILVRLLASRLRREDPFEFVDTLEHELTHALVGYLTLSPPVSLSATLKKGGEVELRGSNPLAALAPYFLPLWCLAALAVGLVARSGVQGAWNSVVFFLLGAFAFRLFHELRWRQTDLHLYGFTFSLLAVAALLLMVLGVILHARGLLSWSWIARAPGRAWALFLDAWDALPERWRPVRPE
jgi:hypothetical protein